MTKTTINSQDIRDTTITDADVATANKDGAAATASMRTLGTPALTLGTANVAGTAGAALGVASTILAFDATVPAQLGTANAAGGGSLSLNIDAAPVGAGYGACYFIASMRYRKTVT